MQPIHDFLMGIFFRRVGCFDFFGFFFFDLLWICGLNLKNYAVADFKNYEVANLRLWTSGITWLRTSGITWLQTCGYEFNNSETSLRTSNQN